MADKQTTGEPTTAKPTAGMQTLIVVDNGENFKCRLGDACNCAADSAKSAGEYVGKLFGALEDGKKARIYKTLSLLGQSVRHGVKNDPTLAQNHPTAILQIKDINEQEFAVLLKYPDLVSLNMREFETKDEDNESDDSSSDDSVYQHENQMEALKYHRDLLIRRAFTTTLAGVKKSYIPNKLYWACGLDITTPYEHGTVDDGGFDLMGAVHEGKVIDMEIQIWKPKR